MNIFKSNEIVQVLDEVTSIWEAAKIVALESDWSVRVKWVEWTSKPAAVIVVPEASRRSVEAWNVRRARAMTSQTNGKRIRARPNAFIGNPAKLTRHEEVC